MLRGGDNICACCDHERIEGSMIGLSTRCLHNKVFSFFITVSLAALHPPSVPPCAGVLLCGGALGARKQQLSCKQGQQPWHG